MTASKGDKVNVAGLKGPFVVLDRWHYPGDQEATVLLGIVAKRGPRKGRVIRSIKEMERKLRPV